MKLGSLAILITCLLIGLTGCEGISKPYIMEMDRVDQKMDIGNRGYLKGTPPPLEDRGELKRPLIAIDIDLPETGTREETASRPVAEERAFLKEEEIK